MISIDELKFKEVKIRTVILIYFIAILIVSVSIFLIIKKCGPDVNETMLLILNLLMDLIVIILIAFAFKPSISGMKILTKDAINKVDKREVIYIVIFRLLVTLGGGKMFIDCLHLIDANFISAFLYDMGIKVDLPIKYAITAVILCLLCPSIEELIFRNIVFKRISKKFNASVGVVISSIVYAAINVGNGISGAFIFGISNCIIYTKYKNIFIPILINISYNVLLCIAVTPIFCNNFNNIIFSKENMVISFLLSSLIFIIGMMLFVRFFNRNKKYIYKYNIELKGN